MKIYRAILFDFDGVIGKTMEDNYHAWAFAFSRYNIHLDREKYFLLEGLNTQGIADRFLPESVKSQEIIDRIVSLKEEYYLQNNRFSLYPGVENLISRLKEMGYLLALVTAANRIRISKTLRHEFIKKFDEMITGDKVNHGKPHPESYLKAADALSMKPSECIAVENTPIGIESAQNAGMYCIAISSTLDKRYLQKANKIIERFIDIEKVQEIFVTNSGSNSWEIK